MQTFHVVVILLEIDSGCSSCQVGLQGNGKAPSMSCQNWRMTNEAASVAQLWFVDLDRYHLQYVKRHVPVYLCHHLSPFPWRHTVQSCRKQLKQSNKTAAAKEPRAIDWFPVNSSGSGDHVLLTWQEGGQTDRKAENADPQAIKRIHGRGKKKQQPREPAECEQLFLQPDPGMEIAALYKAELIWGQLEPVREHDSS